MICSHVPRTTISWFKPSWLALNFLLIVRFSLSILGVNLLIAPATAEQVVDFSVPHILLAFVTGMRFFKGLVWSWGVVILPGCLFHPVSTAHIFIEIGVLHLAFPSYNANGCPLYTHCSPCLLSKTWLTASTFLLLQSSN